MSLTKVTMTGSVDTLSAGMTKVNDIIDDLASTDNGLGASCVGVEDSAGNMSATNVEDALAEIYTDFSTTRTLAETLDEDPDSTVDLTWGYTAGVIRYGTTVTSIAAGTILLTDDATNYVEVNSSGTVSANTTSFTAGRMPLRIVVASGGAQTTSTDKRAWYVGATSYQSASLTNHGILVASGTDHFKSLGAATNGQLPIGSTGADPVLATITGTANEVTVTNGAGTITLSIPSAAVMTFANTGLHLLDTNADHDAIMQCASDLTADRAIYFKPGDSAATIMLGDSSATKAWFHQNTAPTGWTIVDDVNESLLACVKQGSGAGTTYTTGGSEQGTWTQPNHVHATSGHTLTTDEIPAHTHYVSNTDVGSVGDEYKLGASGTTYINKEGWSGDYAYTLTGSGTTPTIGPTSAAGGGQSHTHGNTGNGATANTWRPLAKGGIICVLG